MRNRKWMLGLLGTSLMMMPLMAMDCTPPASDNCTSEADCTADQHCHPTLQVCVDNCKTVEGACDTLEGTACSETDIIEPINAMSFNGVCVCDPTNDTCGGGEKCNPYDRSCETPCTGDADCADYPQSNRTCQDGFCLLPPDDCQASTETNYGCADTQVCDNRSGSTTQGTCIDKCATGTCTGTDVCNTGTGFCQAPCTAGNCGTDQYCDDARFENTGLCKATPTTCDMDGCLDPAELVCDPDDTRESYNLCIDSDEAMNYCDAAGSRDTDGPVIYEIDVDYDLGQGGCASGKTQVAIYATAFDADGNFTSSPYNDSRLEGADGSWIAPYDVDETAVDTNNKLYTIYGCFTDGTSVERGVFTTDAAGNESNRACADILP